MENRDSMPTQGQVISPPRILVVDDEIYIRELMIKGLRQLGYDRVDAASDGADAWAALHAASYSLVITDHKMPRLTGVELIARMRAGGMSQPVILISGTLPTEEIARNPDLRVDALFTKPFNLDKLSATIGSLLRTTKIPVIANESELSPARHAASAQKRGQKSSPRILVVDDDHDSRQLQIELLTSLGYAIEAVNDGAAGWEALRSRDYDLVITDNHMPRMTGLEMIEKLHLARMTTPVIMATGKLPLDEFARKPWLKPEAMLQKPFNNRDLLEMISNILDSDGGNEAHEGTPLPKFF